MNILMLTLCGFIIGFILISVGMGAALYIGCLITFFHLPDKTAAASALVITLPALIVGTYFYHRKNLINYNQGNKLLIWAICGTLGGSLIVPFINQHYYQIIISIILIVLAITILFHVFVDPHLKHQSYVHHKLHRVMANFASVISGIMIGLAGMSGGGPLVAGMLLLDAPMAQAAATSSYIRVWTTLLGIGLHFNTMKIAWNLVFYMILGTTVGALIAPYIMQKINTENNWINRIFKPIIALILLYMGIKPFI